MEWVFGGGAPARLLLELLQLERAVGLGALLAPGTACSAGGRRREGGGARVLPPRPLAERPGVAPLLAGNVLACGGVGAQWGDGSTSRALGSHIALWLAEIPLH